MNYLSKENVHDIFELSLVQKAILENEIVTQVSYEIQMDVEFNQLKSYWEETVRAHDSLRSVYRKLNNRTVQVVLKERPIPIEWVDLHAMEDEKKEVKLQSIAKSHFEEIKIDIGPLIRLSVCRYDEVRTIIIWTQHSLCMDDNSRDRIFNEWMDRAQKIFPTNIQYKSFKEYIDWEASQDGIPAKKYWKEHLRDYKPSPMPLYGGNQNKSNSNKLCTSTSLTNDLSRRLEKIAEKHNVSIEAVALSTWLLLLQVYTGEESVSCGETVSSSANWKGEIVGPFAHVLPIKATLTANQKVDEVLRYIHNQRESIQKNSHVPSQVIRSYTNIAKEVTLFNSIVTVRNSADNKYSIPQLLYIEGRNEIEIIVTVGPNWSIEIFHPNANSLDSLKSLLKFYVTLLENLSKQSNVELYNLNLLSNEEKKLQFEDFNKTNLAIPSLNRLAHQVVEDQARKRPDAIAVVCGMESITYRELNEQANRLAHWLRSQGFGREDLAAILAERGIEMVIGILA
ncbi:AMP-binding protein, partial [Sutcliffiella horikoshii]